MFKKILEALSTQFKGVDAKILVRMARKLAKQIKSEDEIEDKVAEVTTQDFIDMEGDRRANEAQATAVSNYEKKYGLKNGKKANGTGDEPDDDDDADIDDDDTDDDEPVEPARNRKPGTKNNANRPSRRESALEKQVKQLTESVQMLTGTITKMQTERTTKTRRQQYEELFEGVDEKVKNRYLRDFDRLTFKNDEDFEEWLTEKTTEVTQDLQDMGYLNTDGADEGNEPQSQANTQQPGATKTRNNIQQNRQPAVNTNPTQRTTPSGARPPLGGRKNVKPGQVSPSVQAYLDSQAKREAVTQFSTITGIPQVQTPAVPAAGIQGQ